jgi:hypothetical protein
MAPVEAHELDRRVRELVDRHPAMVAIRQLQSYVRWGAGTPEAAVDAPFGAIYADTANGDVYRKTTALGTLTGWTTNFP